MKNSKLSFLLCIICLSHTFAQVHLNNNTSSSNGFKLNLAFDNEPYLLEGENGNIINFFDAIDEGKPGTPLLPSKTIFVAIPPESKIKIRFLEEKTSVINNVLPKANPQIYLRKDSTLNYVDGILDFSLNGNEFYPQEKYIIEGYTWIRNYYCAAVRINTHRYNWQNRQISELAEVKIEITYQD